MLKSLSSSLLGGISLLILSLNTIFWCLILFIFAFIKLITFTAKTRQQFSKLLILIGRAWINSNSFFFELVLKVKFDIQGLEHLSPKESYLVISNHCSWTDIFVLQHIFRQRIPFLKFFLKKELIWVPLLGVAWWALDFPFLKRYSRQFLKKHPELRGKDMETTRKYCEKFKFSPVSTMIFLEGTRFNLQKHQEQKSTYRHLLMPKTGGITLIFSSMGNYVSNVIDVTIVYPKNEPPVGIWDLLQGKISSIVVRVKILSVPKNVGSEDYLKNKASRGEVKQWINKLWQDKDDKIEAVMTGYKASSTTNESVSNKSS